MLCVLRTGAWRATREHRQESVAENARHAVQDIAKVHVRLTSHPALEALGKLHSAARAEHYRLTLPSLDEGVRFIPTTRILEHSNIIKDYAEKHSKLADEFCAAYDQERCEAPIRLNGLYRAEFFPPLEVVRSRFRFSSDYREVPEQGAWQDWLREAGQAAESELRERFADALRRMVETLRQPDKIFRDSLVGNLRDLCDLSGDLNLSGALDIAAVAQAARDNLCTYSPDTLRDSKSEREEAAKRAAGLVSMLTP